MRLTTVDTNLPGELALNLEGHTDSRSYCLPRKSLDFSLYLSYDRFSAAIEGDPKPILSVLKRERSLDMQLKVKGLPNSDPKQEISGRANVCFCGRGKWLAITIRGSSKGVTCTGAATGTQAFEAFSPSSEREAEYLNTFDDLTESIFGFIADKKGLLRLGLLVVCGGMGSGKTNMARLILRTHFHALKTMSPERVPHLITIEDPIEKWACGSSDKAFLPGEAMIRGLDYTPRQLGIDVPSISRALLDARRQTPSVVYISERSGNWKIGRRSFCLPGRATGSS